jgi:DNA-binding NtrC family response regulator
LPTLRERREDIPLLTYYFMAKHAPRFQKLVTGISQPAMQMLLLYEWPGNVRELEHTVERALVLAESEIIGPKQIILPTARKVASQASFQELKGILVGEFERAYIKSVLLACGGNINRAAQAARKNRRAFWQLMRKHDIKADDYKSTGI